MKSSTLILALLGTSAIFSACNQQTQQQQPSSSLHDSLTVVDGHNDVIITSILPGRDIGQHLSQGHTDIPRLIEGGVDVQVFAVWSDDKKWPTGGFQHANDQIDALEAVLNENPDKIQLARHPSDISAINKEGKIAALIGIEGGNMIEGSLENLEKLRERGAIYLTLTWNYNLPWATAAAVAVEENEDPGLSDHGKEIIRKLNELGMMIDLSHSSKQTFYDAIETSTKPVLVSHSNAAALTPHYRNLDDEQLAALKANGGVIGVNFYSDFLDSEYLPRLQKLYAQSTGETPSEDMDHFTLYNALSPEEKHQADAPLNNLLDHIDYLVSKVGIDHVAIGSDFDGIESSPQGLEDVSKFPVLTQALLDRGYNREDLAKIMGENFLRVWKENEN